MDSCISTKFGGTLYCYCGVFLYFEGYWKNWIFLCLFSHGTAGRGCHCKLIWNCGYWTLLFGALPNRYQSRGLRDCAKPKPTILGSQIQLHVSSFLASIVLRKTRHERQLIWIETSFHHSRLVVNFLNGRCKICM